MGFFRTKKKILPEQDDSKQVTGSMLWPYTTYIDKGGGGGTPPDYNAVKQQVNENKQNITSIDGKVNSLETEVQNLDESLANTQVDMNNVVTRIGTLESYNIPTWINNTQSNTQKINDLSQNTYKETKVTSGSFFASTVNNNDLSGVVTLPTKLDFKTKKYRVNIWIEDLFGGWGDMTIYTSASFQATSYSKTMYFWTAINTRSEPLYNIYTVVNIDEHFIRINMLNALNAKTEYEIKYDIIEVPYV